MVNFISILFLYEKSNQNQNYNYNFKPTRTIGT